MTEAPSPLPGEQDSAASAPSRWRRPLPIVGACLAALVLLLAIAAVILANHLQPILKARVIAALESKFDANVRLDRLHVALAHEVLITGGGLTITPHDLTRFPPAVQVRDFRFTMHPLHLFDTNRHVRDVHMDGLVLTFAPAAIAGANTGAAPAGVTGNYTGLLIDALHVTDAKIVILNNDPDKLTRTVEVPDLRLTAPAAGPLHWVATVVVPEPRGTLHGEGDFGPWNNADPRASPINGSFDLENADLAAIKGIAGSLTDHGTFSGPINHLTLDGKTSTPDFRLTEAEHPVALTANYHAIVDATTGDTYLQPVDAFFRHTHLTCTGSVVNLRGQGHQTSLNCTIPSGRIEDAMWLSVRQAQPLLTGNITLKTSIDIPPNPTHTQTVGHRLRLKGNFRVTHASFSNPRTDRTIDEASLRTQGKVAEAEQLSKDPTGNAGAVAQSNIAIQSTMTGSFSMADASFAFHPATFAMPGINATMNGSYTLDGKTLHVDGEARLAVPVSKMVSGWKSLLLRPFNGLFRKDGAPAVIHFHVDGPKADPEIAVDIGSHLRIGMKRR